MYPTILLKTLMAAVLGRTGLARRSLDRAAKGRAGILMYHRVLPPRQRHAGIEPGMYVDARTFAQQVAFLNRNCRIVPLDRISEAWEGNGSGQSRPVCALTFDDGWVDFMEHAYPVLEAQKVPATVFLPTDFIGTDKWFWTDRLANLLHGRQQANELQKAALRTDNAMVRRILGCSGSPAARLDKAISELKPCPPAQIEDILQEMATALGVEPSSPGRAFLNWEEIRTMAASGLISFGSHTAGHAILTTIGRDTAKMELLASKNRLLAEKVVDAENVPFCYPNGNFNAHIADQVRRTGYNLAVTTEYGWNGSGGDVFALKRIPIHNDMTATRDMFLCRLAGLL